jgi:hypothetical protein
MRYRIRRDHRYCSDQYLGSLIRDLLSNFLKLDNRSRGPWNQWFHDWRESSDFITGFITLGYSTLVQQIYWLWKILLVYTLQSIVLLECVQLKSRFITIKLYFTCTGLNRVPQEKPSSDTLQFWCGLPILFINTNIKNIPDYGVFFDTSKLSDSGTEKRLRNGPFAKTQGVSVLHPIIGINFLMYPIVRPQLNSATTTYQYDTTANLFEAVIDELAIRLYSSTRSKHTAVQLH